MPLFGKVWIAAFGITSAKASRAYLSFLITILLLLLSHAIPARKVVKHPNCKKSGSNSSMRLCPCLGRHRSAKKKQMQKDCSDAGAYLNSIHIICPKTSLL